MSHSNKKTCNRIAVSVFLITTLGLGSTSVMAAERADCLALVGTYVTTVTDREGVFSSRGLLTFTADGVLLVSDSAQGGVPEVWDPFSPTQGTWNCEAADAEKITIRALGLNFVLPTDGRSPSFGRVDDEATLDTKSDVLSRKASLSFTSGKDPEGIDPIEKPGPLVDEFQFDGKRLVVKE